MHEKLFPSVLIAGGAGFIGSHLSDRLIENGNTVVCADKLIMGEDNIRHLMDNKKYVFRNVDLSLEDTVDNLFNDYHFDAVYHLAANSDIKKGGMEPSIDFGDTFLTTRNILESGLWRNA